MKEEKLGSLPKRNHRRRRVVDHTQNRQLISSCDYYDDEDDGHKKLGHHEDRIFKGSCSFGQFVVNPCLCLINTAISCFHRQSLHQNEKIGKLMGKGRKNPKFLLAFALFLVFLRTQFSLLRPELSVPIGRHLSDEALNQMPITIPKFENKKHDIGGWKHSRGFFYPTVPLPLNHSPQERDFGGLKILVTEKPENSTFPDGKGSFASDKHMLADPRIIHPKDGKMAERRWNRITRHDPHMHSWAKFPDDLEDTKEDCRYPNFAKKYYPQCNMVHEVALGEKFDPELAVKPGYSPSFDMFYISHGAFRDVWVVDQPFPESAKTALKMNRYKRSWNYETYWNTLNDALVMERLTGSPRIVDIYAHCGGTVWVEGLPHEVEEVIIPGKGMVKPEDLPEELTPMNNYTLEEKLDLALSMAESLADLHGFRDGVIVHDDVQLCQWLKKDDGTLKLGDFNRAEVMEYNTKKERYCKYVNGESYGNYRAPEEFDEDYLNEQIDVFSFGNNIYGLLTGLWVFYDVDDDGEVHKKLIDGTRAYIDPRWKERSYIEVKLMELTEKCWIEDVDERIDIFGAVKELRAIKKEHERRKANNNVASDK